MEGRWNLNPINQIRVVQPGPAGILSIANKYWKWINTVCVILCAISGCLMRSEKQQNWATPTWHGRCTWRARLAWWSHLPHTHTRSDRKNLERPWWMPFPPGRVGVRHRRAVARSSSLTAGSRFLVDCDGSIIAAGSAWPWSNRLISPLFAICDCTRF